ncbi:2-oxoglutarate-dependent dioxygenase htyE-like [Branchiostoma floridae]|uniref:2-oxoglutarate-dependent dioxygenase htyE-like n=1 Tax=Branchiostoma floridae TaxID=7739 RepID=A0A9J7L6A2_BRAFL|nr:2-oxoglutarate-dependent dioxygenase htyE-like [Branchiostoma floridae]
MGGYIRVIDFSAYSLGTENISEADLAALTKELMHSFTTSGFAYLKNTGISEEQVDAMYDVNDRFYDLPAEIKEKYARANDKNRERQGWACVERESSSCCHWLYHIDCQAKKFIHSFIHCHTYDIVSISFCLVSLSGLAGVIRPGDLKEYFGVKIPLTEDESWPYEVPEFEETCLNFYAACKGLTFRILELIARGLGIEVAGFLDMFKHMGTGPNGTNLRSLRYPPIPKVVKEDQLRCGEHTDLGCVTLLFQDRPGLEVSTGKDNFVSAPPIPGTVVVNIGDMLQWWTADKLVSTKHRVIIPETAEGQGQGRRSIAFFAHADSDVQLKCLDGSDKHKPMIVRDYVKMKLHTTYL